MKKIRTVIAVILCVIVVAGWGTQAKSKLANQTNRQKYLELAAGHSEQGLFQKAIAEYESAQAIKYSQSVAETLVETYKKSFEDGTNTRGEYIDAYTRLCQNHPNEEKYWRGLLQLCIDAEDFSKGNEICKLMTKLNVKTENLLDLTDKFNYYYTERGRTYTSVRGGLSGYYTVGDGSDWEIITPSGEGMRKTSATYINAISDNLDYVAVTEKDARLIDANGVVQAILSKSTDNMRAYGGGMIPMQQKDGKWNYYNIEKGDYTLKGYDEASTFCRGMAAVKSGNSWRIIDVSGNPVFDITFSEIKLFSNGAFTDGSLFVAAVDGIFNLYDLNGKAATKIDAKDMDLFCSSAVAFENADGKWGYINSKGDIVIEPQFASAKSFSNGLAGVSNGEKWAFINQSGRVVSDYAFIDVGYCSNAGYCFVSDINGVYFQVCFSFLWS